MHGDAELWRPWPLSVDLRRGPPAATCDPQIYAREHLWPVTPHHAPGGIHGAALPESVSPAPERVRGGDDRWTRAGCVRTTDRESQVPGWHVGGPGYTSREPNTHNTESREVCYPWHPWFGCWVVVYERRVKYGQAVCRCGLQDRQDRGSVEIPTWMFESAACCRLGVMAVPTVGCDALLELKALLRTAQRPGSGS